MFEHLTNKDNAQNTSTAITSYPPFNFLSKLPSCLTGASIRSRNPHFSPFRQNFWLGKFSDESQLKLWIVLSWIFLDSSDLLQSTDFRITDHQRPTPWPGPAQPVLHYYEPTFLNFKRREKTDVTKPQNGKRWVAGCVTVWGRIIIETGLGKTRGIRRASPCV